MGILMFAPLPFGASPGWAQAVIEAGVAVVAALWLLGMLSSGELVLRRHPLLWPGLLMGVIVAVQLVVPGRSVSPHATVESARLYAAYLMLLVVLSGYLSTRARILQLTWAMVAWGVAMALLGLTNHALGSTRLLWLPKWPELDRLTATFRNPNHQALYFAICLFLVLGLILRPGRSDGRRGGSWMGPAADDERSGRLAVSVTLVGFALVLAIALALTLSRGAVVSVLGALAALLLLLAMDRSRSRLPYLVVGGLIVFAAYAAWVGMEAITGRLIGVAREPFGDLRWTIWEATLRMAVETPLLGVGLGAYQDAFTRFRPTVVPADKMVDFAHNDYLQLLAETGVVGLGVLAWALVALTAFVVNRLVLRRDPSVKGLTIGALCALAVVALHSLLDYGLHRPANALLVVAVAALAPAIVTWRVHRNGEAVDLPAWRWRLAGATRVYGAGAVVIGLVLAMLWLVPPGVADWKLQSALTGAGRVERVRGSVSLQELAAARRDLEQAVRWDPHNPRAQAALGEVVDDMAWRMWVAGVDAEGRRLADTTVETRFRATENLFATAYGAYQRSLERRPMGADVHQSFGWLLGRLDVLRHAVRGTSVVSSDPAFADLLRADDSLAARGLAEVTLGAQLDPYSALRQRNLALYAMTVPVDGPSNRRVAADAFRRALTIEPKLLGKVVEDLGRADQTLILDSVPRNHALRLELARQLEQRGRWQGAWAAFEEAISLAAMPAQEVEARLAYGHALLRRADRERALSQARQALVAFPSHPAVFVLLGDVYESLGQLSEAEAALTSAVTVAGFDTSRRATGYRARLASFLARHGQGDRAVALWRQVLQSAPNDPWLRLQLAHTLEARGDRSGAFVEYQTASSLGGRDVGLHWEVGRALARAGHTREAIAAYERASGLWPRDAEIRSELAELFIRSGAPDRAAEQYRRILAVHPGHEGAGRGLTNLAARVPDGRP